MTSDLVERLRALGRCEHDDHSLGPEAADEIERLRAEVTSARNAALEEAAKVASDAWLKSEGTIIGDAEDDLCEEIATAIRALGEKG